MPKTILRWLIRLVGTALLLFFLWRLQLDPLKIWQQLAHANLALVLVSVGLAFPFFWLKSWRWQLILKDLGINIGSVEAYRLYALGLSAASFTPGQSGDLIKAWQLGDRGHKFAPSLLSIILDRLFDLAILVLLATSGLFFLGTDFSEVLPALIILLIGTLAGLVILIVPTSRMLLLNFAIKLFVRKKLKAAEPSPELKALNFLPIFGLTMLASGLALFRIWLLALSLGLALSPMETVATSSLATVVSLLPISIGGIGARDLALAGILGKLGYSLEQAVGLSSFVLLLQIVNLVFGYWVGHKTVSWGYVIKSEKLADSEKKQ